MINAYGVAKHQPVKH